LEPDRIFASQLIRRLDNEQIFNIPQLALCAGNNISAASQRSPDELTLHEQLEVVDQMARAGVSLVVLSGGEPLTNRNLGVLSRESRNRRWLFQSIRMEFC
jgi:molybdenum cofactor biosynthesis enzyme MoaA